MGTIRSVNILVRDRDGRTLLQMRDGSASIAPLCWGFWGGALEGYESAVDAAARELTEELGVQASPDDFSVIAHRGRPDGQMSALALFGRPLGWGDFRVNEGAGAGFFWKHEMLQLPLTRPVIQHLETHPQFFADPPE